jgi:hypothetical protein
MSRHYSGPDFGFPCGDARLGFADLYAFPKPGEAGKSILVMNLRPSAVANPSGPATAALAILVNGKVDRGQDWGPRRSACRVPVFGVRHMPEHESRGIPVSSDFASPIASELRGEMP